MKIYIAGNINRQAWEESEAQFQAAEDSLREQGYEVVNPFKTGLTASTPWEESLAQGIIQLLKSDEVYMLSGWEESRLAVLYGRVAKFAGKKIIYEQERDFHRIRQAIFDAMGVTYVDMAGDCRDQKMVFARMIFAHLCRKEGASVKEIAEELGRDHSTVIYYLKNYANDISCTAAFKRYAEEVEQSLKTLTK